jgi:hypothetical protein
MAGGYSDYLRRVQDPPGQYVSPTDCARELGVLLRHEQWMGGFRQTHPAYLMVDYQDVPRDFETIARFVGSGASAMEIEAILRRPPTLKLPSAPFEAYFANASELRSICDYYENRRLAMRARSVA